MRVTHSIVIPVHNEEESLSLLHERVAAAVDRQPGRWEFILVDDGSRDRTWEGLAALHRKDPRVRAIKLKRNFGQTPAMACGIDLARGDIVVTMDGDLQNDPADIPRLLAKLDEGYDVVCGWRHRRQDKLWTRKVPSMIANRLIGAITGVRLHDYGCSLKAYRADAIKRTPLYAEFHRFIPALSTLTGALIAELKVEHHARQFGRTKYTISRTWRVMLDMLTVSMLLKFAAKPFRLFGALSVAAFAVAVACGVHWWSAYAQPADRLAQTVPGITALSAWMGGHLLVVGLVAELCLATTHARPHSLIAERR